MSVHLYVAGPPCQPSSTQGSGRGVLDVRGHTLQAVLNYVQVFKPEVVVLENVKGMLDRHEYCLRHIIMTLEKRVATL